MTCHRAAAEWANNIGAADHFGGAPVYLDATSTREELIVWCCWNDPNRYHSFAELTLEEAWEVILRWHDRDMT